MKAVSSYKAMIEELGKMVWVFANFQEYPFNEMAKEQGWTLDYIKKIQGKVQASTIIPEQIKEELIGDGDEAKFVGRLRTAFFELGADPNFALSYYPEFDEACFALPSKDNPDKNKDLIDALVAVYGDEAAPIMVRLESICQTANNIVQDVCSMLDEVCKFVGYTPEPQQGEQEQQSQQGEQEQQNEKGKEIPTLKNTDKERLVFGNALMKQYMSLDKDKYKWHKPYNLLAYMCGRLYCGDRVIDIDDTEELKKGHRQMPRTAVKELFSGIDVANNRYSMKEPPTDYWIIDDLFKDKGGVSR